MKTDDYNIGDRVMSEYNETFGYGTIIEKKIILRVSWDSGKITPEMVLRLGWLYLR